MPGKCRICGCTQMDGCPGGCDWAEPDLCTVCSDFKVGLSDYIESCRRVSTTSLRRLFSEAGVVIQRKPRTKSTSGDRT